MTISELQQQLDELKDAPAVARSSSAIQLLAIAVNLEIARSLRGIANVLASENDGVTVHQGAIDEALSRVTNVDVAFHDIPQSHMIAHNQRRESATGKTATTATTTSTATTGSRSNGAQTTQRRTREMQRQLQGLRPRPVDEMPRDRDSRPTQLDIR